MTLIFQDTIDAVILEPDQIQHPHFTRFRSKRMEERLAKIEQAYEEMKRDMESKLDKAQQDTRTHIS